jgi:hypothetical protein
MILVLARTGGFIQVTRHRTSPIEAVGVVAAVDGAHVTSQGRNYTREPRFCWSLTIIWRGHYLHQAKLDPLLVQYTVLNRFRNMLRPDLAAVVQVSQRTGHFQNPVMCPHA